MPAISFQHVSKVFDGGDSGAPAVRDVTLDVEEREFVVLLGPSGCGKTTLLRMVNRLTEPTSGEIFVDGTEIHQIPATELRRRIGYVIQQVGLFPHMTIADNVAVVPKLLGWPKTRIQSRVNELLDLVDLAPDRYRKRYPAQLSGGQQQRVGIARAIAADPSVLLMDEPFGAIDAITRGDLQNELLKIQRMVGKTVIFVTHDVDEALRLANRIAVMRAGHVVQYATPLEILAQPADDFVRALLDTDDIYRQLSLVTAGELMTPAQKFDSNGLSTGIHDDVRSALSMLIAHGADELTVTGQDGTPVGRLSLERILAEGSREALRAAGTQT
jgi:osmoprotectant transport system ATP-binding protein